MPLTTAQLATLKTELQTDPRGYGYNSAARNDTDPVLALVPLDRRATLVAKRDSLSDGSLEWNIVLQGADETVFFEW